MYRDFNFNLEGGSSEQNDRTSGDTVGKLPIAIRVMSVSLLR